MTAKRTQILDSEAIAQKVRRMAYEIVEDCYEDKELVLVGIEPNGYEFARLLKSEIEKIQGQTVVLHSLAIDKEQPDVQAVKTSFAQGEKLKNKTLIVADDVGNTGRTLFYALAVFTAMQPKKIKTAVLVERQHKRFPVASDFVGLSLSTTLQEKIVVEFNGKKGIAYLE
ncbi:MAG: phosphoribosyltransferase [Chitinophagales bacterium]|nr:phosphoribosyltransferase [Chitinophagales bacterium]